jgi:hypothetical protein
MTPSEQARVRELLDALSEGTLDAVGMQELDARAQSDPHVHTLLIAYLELDGYLRWEFGTGLNQPEKVPAIEVAQAPKTVTSVAPLAPPVAVPVVGVFERLSTALGQPVFWSIFATSIAFAGYVAFISWNILGTETQGVRLEARGAVGPQATSFESQASNLQPAYVSSSDNAKWHKPPRAGLPAANAADRSTIANGEPLVLASGAAELKLRQGVTLVIEGPAEWTIDGNNRATLTRGKLLATVPKRAIGFVVKTPTTEIVDLGTEFGVEVSEQGETRTHVFRGEIRLDQSVVASATAAKSITLTAGQAVRVDRSGSTTFIEPLASTPAQFIRPPAAAAEVKFNPAELSPFAKYVIEKTNPAAYWDFSWYRDSMKIVNDRIAGYPFEQFTPRHVGVLGPAANLGFAGMEMPNPALEFDQHFSDASLALPVHCPDDPDSTRQFTPPLPPQAYSLQVWIQSSIGFDQQRLHYVWSLGLPGVVDDALLVSGSHFSKVSLPQVPTENIVGRLVYLGRNDDRELRFGPTLLEPHRWYCVTFVRNQQQVAIYLNGKLEIESSLPWAKRTDNLLTFCQRASRLPDAGWQGLLDEIAIWDRALSPEEVAAIYEQSMKPHFEVNPPD